MHLPPRLIRAAGTELFETIVDGQASVEQPEPDEDFRRLDLEELFFVYHRSDEASDAAWRLRQDPLGPAPLPAGLGRRDHRHRRLLRRLLSGHHNEEMRAAIEAYPEGFLDAIGFTDVTSAAGYLGSTTFGLLAPALVIVFAAAIGGSAMAGEEDSGRLDLTLTRPVSRWSVVWQRFAAIVAAMLVVAVALALGVVAISGPADLGEIGPVNVFAAAIQLGLMGTLFGAIALAVGAATGRRSLVCAAVAVVSVAGFFGNNQGPSIEGLAWLTDVSPFGLYLGGAPLRNGFQLVDSAILAIASIVLVGAGGLLFDRRDVAV